ncbi:threonine/serine exporter family protein [Clostridium sp. P21]|uniref:Threonine/serine exporter family protein n=1 Tax=Clostridium muellerianum TaxID=2716538 RepID=A0A7Y0ELA6_9CLOT|nr:threonine/serine exporter family protein [Clostridium muellerianum]NMM65563.1 threonine/serine exporter family protein [Clostridium muellerianum]
MDVNRIINVATYAGKIMLENGAEIYRVEETIVRICSAYGIYGVDTFVTITVIMASAEQKYQQTISVVKRIKKRTLNIEKISRVNDISRNIRNKGYTLEFVEDKLKNIDSMKPYSNKVNVVFSGMVAAFFTLVYGGNIRDFSIAFIIGCLIRIISIEFSSLETNEFFINILCGALTAVTALSMVHFGIATNSDKIIIGSIMLLVPGLAITNAIRDTIAGDLISGISRGIEAFLIAVAIAAGTGVVLKLWFNYFGGV